MSGQMLYCQDCMEETPHIKAGASTIMCTVCRKQRPWSTIGWGEASSAGTAAIGSTLCQGGLDSAPPC
jgi:hypothetical protein